MSTESEPSAAISNKDYFYTAETDPSKHGLAHLGQIYQFPEQHAHRSTVRDDLKHNRNRNSVFRPEHEEFSRIFNEFPVLIRKPALEIFDHYKNLDWAKTEFPVRFMIHGHISSGKSVTLAHVKHFLTTRPDLIMLNFHSMNYWTKRYTGVEESTFKKGRYDHLGDSNIFLVNFLAQNEEKLKGLKTTRDYSWSFKEKSEKDSELTEMVKLGIDRSKYSADVLNVLINELKWAAKERKIKLAVTVPHIHQLFRERTTVSKDLKDSGRMMITMKKLERMCLMEELSVLIHVKRLLTEENPNIFVVATVDPMTNQVGDKGKKWFRFSRVAWSKNKKSSNPWRERMWKMEPHFDYERSVFQTLGEDGVRGLDPFVPIEVPKLTDGEMDVIIDYFLSKNYLLPSAATEMGRREIR